MYTRECFKEKTDCRRENREKTQTGEGDRRGDGRRLRARSEEEL